MQKRNDEKSMPFFDVEARATYIIIPNGEIYSNTITVNTARDRIRTEHDLGIGYGDDIELAMSEVLKAMKEADVLVVDLADNSVLLKVRWWTLSKRADVNLVRSNVLKQIKLRFDKAGIDIPFPTQLVLWHDQTEETDGDRRKQREGWPSGDNPPKPLRQACSTTLKDKK